MSRFRDHLEGWIGPVAFVGVLLMTADFARAAEGPHAGIGRAATPQEVKAWDIDVRPDFKGLPKGAGSVADGARVWEGKCASCHGVFGESNEVFAPMVGGTSKEDVQHGRVSRLKDASYPGRTTLMKLSTVSTLWDYINRAMPWNAPKSLSTAEVYGVTAYILNLGGIVPDDFVLTDRNIAEVQKRLPNRDGMTTAHGMWPGSNAVRSRPDVAAVACMTNCSPESMVASFLPDHARGAHGNLADQNRMVGPQRGANTSPTTKDDGRGETAGTQKMSSSESGTAAVLLQKHACTACHGVNSKIVGPSFRDIAKKYADRADAASYLAQKATSGSAGVWGSVPMPPQALDPADALAIARWIAGSAGR